MQLLWRFSGKLERPGYFMPTARCGVWDVWAQGLNSCPGIRSGNSGTYVLLASRDRQPDVTKGPPSRTWTWLPAGLSLPQPRRAGAARWSRGSSIQLVTYSWSWRHTTGDIHDPLLLPGMLHREDAPTRTPCLRSREGRPVHLALPYQKQSHGAENKTIKQFGYS